MNGYITLDYELGLGNYTGTPEKCLIEPMNHLIQMVNRYGIKLNIFVDASYLLQMKKIKDGYPQLQKDYELIVNHIRHLDSQGHAIQLHLHPQWCYSTFNGIIWELDKEHYKLSDMPLDKQKQLIIDGTNLLNSLVSHKVTAFRAGGYSIENFPELYETFLSVGITIDSSVLRGEFASGKYQSYNYTNVPFKTEWFFNKNHKEEDPTGLMTEYPISALLLPTFLYLINKYSKHKEFALINSSKLKWGDGIGIGRPGNKLTIIIQKAKLLCGKKCIKAAIEDGENLEKIFNYSTKHYHGNNFVIIGHPKAISPYSIDVLEKFINNHKDIEFQIF